VSNETKLDPIYLQAIQIAVIKFTYGDVIKLSWLHENFEIEIPEFGSKKDYEQCTFKFMACMDMFRETLLKEHLMMLSSVRGVGYRVLNPNEQPDEAMSRLKSRVKKETTKAMESLSFINEALLDDESAKKRDSSMGKIAALSAFSKTRLSA